MFGIFGSQAAQQGGIFSNPGIILLLIIFAIYIFLKFCSWAKKFQLTGGVKKVVYILTGVGLVVFNLIYAKGNAVITETGDWSTATIALVGSLIWVFIFSFALMAETKAE